MKQRFGNMKSWVFWNTKLSSCYAVFLMLNYSYLVLSGQFFILRVRLLCFLFGDFKATIIFTKKQFYQITFLP